MKIALGALAVAAVLGVAGAACADPEVIVKCGTSLADGMRFTRDTGWQPFPNPDKQVIITRDKGKYAIAVEGDAPYTSATVFPIPMTNVERFRVLRPGGAEVFHLEKDAASGKPVLKHTIRGGRDGSHVYNIREATLNDCSVVASDLVVSAPVAPGTAGGN